MSTTQRHREATHGQEVEQVDFPLGRLAVTPGASQKVPDWELFSALARHSHGDWGDLDQEDWEQNDLSLHEGLRLLSVYRTQSGDPFWIITEADRSATTVLLPEEY